MLCLITLPLRLWLHMCLCTCITEHDWKFHRSTYSCRYVPFTSLALLTVFTPCMYVQAGLSDSFCLSVCPSVCQWPETPSILDRITLRQSLLACVRLVGSARPVCRHTRLKNLWYGRHFLLSLVSYSGFCSVWHELACDTYMLATRMETFTV